MAKKYPKTYSPKGTQPGNGTQRKGTWYNQLESIRRQIPGEEQHVREKQANRRKEAENINKLKKLSSILCILFTGYKKNSGILTNNIFRGRTWLMYLEEIWDTFDPDVVFPSKSAWDIFIWYCDEKSKVGSYNIMEKLSYCSENQIPYLEVNEEYIDLIVALYDAFTLHPTIKDVNAVYYRGCNTLERNGMNGIVSATPDMQIALQFSRGTLLIIEVPEGMSYIDVAKIRQYISPKKVKDPENEVLFPPCNYHVVETRTIKKGSWGSEPNNIQSDETKVIRIVVDETYNLLQEFYKVLINLPEEYALHYDTGEGSPYSMALKKLEFEMQKRGISIK